MFRATVVLGLISLVISKNAPSEKRIVGGITALIQDLPYVVSIQRKNVHVCGGSIIAPRWILTASHCIVPLENMIDKCTIRAGSTIWSSGGQKIGIKKMMKHSNYNPNTNAYDIGLIQLVRPLEYDVTVHSIELATMLPANGKNALICGWGLKKENADTIPNMLQKANVTIISRSKCSSEDYKYHDDILDSMFCAKNPGIDSCQGDSGGPLIAHNEQYGVVSFGKGCGNEDYPGVYISVAISSISSWISEVVDFL